MDILEDLRTTTFSNNEAFFKKAACEIEQLRTENAALKEQVAHIKEIEFPTKCIAIANIWKNKVTLLDETIAQQAAVIEQMREALRHYAYRAGQDWQIAREALALQPSPEILQARDEWVAEAQGKAVSNLITGTTAKQYQEAIDKAYEQGKKDAVPEGWVLVPVKPTPEMINAAANVNPEYGSTWAAYLSAAPKQEKNDEPV